VTPPAMIATTEAYGFTFAYPAGDLTVGTSLREFGEFGRVGSTIAAELARGAVFVDVGANIGAYALPVSRDAARVIAIEAHPGLAGLLARNVAENGLGNIEIIAAAAGPAAGEVAFPTADLGEHRNFGSLSLARGAKATAPTPMVRLDDVAPADTRLVKIDVEGFEPAVLAGATRLRAEVRPYWMVELDGDGPQGRALVRDFQVAGYRTWWLYDPFVTPRAPRGDWRRAFGRGDLSLLAAPAEAEQPSGMVEAVGEDYAWATNTQGFDYLARFDFPAWNPRT